MFMRKIIPSLTIRAVIFAHRAPCSFAEIRSPKIPALNAAGCFLETDLFGIHLDGSGEFNPNELLTTMFSSWLKH